MKVYHYSELLNMTDDELRATFPAIDRWSAGMTEEDMSGQDKISLAKKLIDDEVRRVLSDGARPLDQELTLKELAGAMQRAAATMAEWTGGDPEAMTVKELAKKLTDAHQRIQLLEARLAFMIAARQRIINGEDPSYSEIPWG